MRILTSGNIECEKTCVALGNFDGVHIGHKAIIESAVKYAALNSMKSCVYTFSSHTSCILGNEKKLLTNTDERQRLIENLGSDYLYADDFSAIRNYSPKEFCKKILIEKLHTAYVFCGYNYRFGNRGMGDIDVLRREMNCFGTDVSVIPFVSYNGETVSSTRIRNSISSGNMAEAVAMLGHGYVLTGNVEHGKKLGRKLGFPTLNIPISNCKVIPKYGVYVSKCELNGKIYNSISNVGIRPTTDSDLTTNNVVNCETFLFDFSENAYGKNISVSLYEMLRSECKFNSVEELRQQIQNDIITAKEIFNNDNRSFL